MKERPIIFSYAMIKAIMAGSKTFTRRIVKDPYQNFPKVTKHITSNEFDFHLFDGIGKYTTCPYGSPGDHLWVRETWDQGCMGGAIFKADYSEEELINAPGGVFKWKSPFHLKRINARLFLEIISTNVERVQEITKINAIREGFLAFPTRSLTPDLNFQLYWKALNGNESYDANPWVWVIEFKRIS